MATTTAGALAARDYRGNPNSQQGELRTYLTASIEWLRDGLRPRRCECSRHARAVGCRHKQRTSRGRRPKPPVTPSHSCARCSTGSSCSRERRRRRRRQQRPQKQQQQHESHVSCKNLLVNLNCKIGARTCGRCWKCARRQRGECGDPIAV